MRGADAVLPLALGSMLLLIGLFARGPLRAVFLLLGIGLLVVGYVLARRR